LRRAKWRRRQRQASRRTKTFVLSRSVLHNRAPLVNNVYTMFVSLDGGQCCWVGCLR
jgi:hypothetical protein